MMKRIFVLISASLCCVFGSSMNFSESPGVQDRKQPRSATFMAQKLDFSRDIVEGLSTENFPLISKASQDLMLLSHEADWNVVTTPEYLKASSEFRETVTRLRDAGKTRNLDAATLAYFEVTLNCVRCHQRLRTGPANKSNSK